MNLAVSIPVCKPPFSFPLVFADRPPVDTTIALAFGTTIDTIWPEPEPDEAWSLAVEAQLAPRRLYRAPQHPSARTHQLTQLAAANGGRYDDTNENYPNHVWDKEERRWVKKTEVPRKAKANGPPFETTKMREAEPVADDAPPEIITRRASEIRPEPIDWVWKYWLARGKLHILAGVPEAGKTTIALSHAAIVSSGDKWPDRTKAKAGNVLIWTSEDDPADTLIPRLMRMGANLNRIHIIEQTRPHGMKPRPFNPATDLDALVAKAKAIGEVALAIIDSVVSAVPITRNSHNNAETRSGLQPVVDFAKAAHVATLGISHLTKGTIGRDPLERLAGSLAFGALPRLVMFAAQNNAEGDGEPERIMIRVKSNIGPSGGGFGYHIDMARLHEQPDIEATRIVWELPLEGNARELLADAEGDQEGKAPRLEQAKRFLRAALAKGARPQKEVLATALAEGITEKTLRRAAKEEGISARKDKALDGAWFWSL